MNSSIDCIGIPSARAFLIFAELADGSLATTTVTFFDTVEDTVAPCWTTAFSTFLDRIPVNTNLLPCMSLRITIVLAVDFVLPCLRGFCVGRSFKTV